jgi:ABC-type multidrug transport system fused ATPase/permease subunit
MTQKIIINSTLRYKEYFFYIRSTKTNKHFMMKEIQKEIIILMYFFLFIFFIISMFLLGLTWVFEAWSVQRKHYRKMRIIDNFFRKRGLSHSEKAQYLREHVELTDWSECLFLQLPGILWLLSTLAIIWNVFEDEDYYARKLSKYIVYVPENDLKKHMKNC